MCSMFNRYTTPLDKSLITEEQNKKAEQIAKDITNQTSTNVHILEERGKAVGGVFFGKRYIYNIYILLYVKRLIFICLDGWDDEEAKYGAVVGSGDFTDAKYKPPSRRGPSGVGLFIACI